MEGARHPPLSLLDPKPSTDSTNSRELNFGRFPDGIVNWCWRFCFPIQAAFDTYRMHEAFILHHMCKQRSRITLLRRSAT